MTTLNPPPLSNAIEVFAYERFNFVISNPIANLSSTLLVSNTAGLNPTNVYFTNNNNRDISFSVSDASNNLTGGTTERFDVTATLASDVRTSINTVTIRPGRFLDGVGASLANRLFTFFKNEPITPIRLVAPGFAIRPPAAILSLPPGLRFESNASNIYDIVGTPSIPVALSNYKIVGIQTNGSKIVTSDFSIVVSNERIQTNLSGSPIIDAMQIGQAIVPRVLTSILPTPNLNLRYTFPPPPDGIVVKNSAGVTQTTSFIPSDPSYTLVLEGTPTETAAQQFRARGSRDLNYVINTTRPDTTPPLSKDTALTFRFGETVLFDTPNSSTSTFFVGIPVDSSTNFFRAETYFTDTPVLITSINSPNLRSDLSLAFGLGGRVEVTGTPGLPTGSAAFTLRATNANSRVRDLTHTINVQNDIVSFVTPTPTIDACYNFILSRPLTSPKEGFYTSNIRFAAEATSRLPVTLSASGLEGTGLSLSANGTIVGLPSQVTPLRQLRITASVSGSPATATRDVSFAIVNDAFTFTDVCSTTNLSFVENAAIPRFQFQVSNLSGRNIIGYSQTGFPSGISIDPAGVIFGTPSSSSPVNGNVTITAQTGFASGSRDFSYSIVPDAILFTTDEDVYAFTARQVGISVQVRGTSFSGTTVRDYGMNLDPAYGLDICATTGLITGTWTDSIPPNKLLPARQDFVVSGRINDFTDTVPGVFFADPIIQNTSFIWSGGNFYSSNPTTSWVRKTSIPNTPTGFDIEIKNNRVDGNFILVAASNVIYRATNASVFSGVNVGGGEANQIVSSLAFNPASQTWWAAGSRVTGGVRRASIIRSSDNGLTWGVLGAPLPLVPRDLNASSGTNPYLRAGIALKYEDGVLMAGALSDGSGTMIRSTDDGTSWSSVTGAFDSESAYYNFDVSGMWIATGSTTHTSVGGPAIEVNNAVEGVDYTITTVSNRVIYTFFATGKTMTITSGARQVVDYLLVGGGGGGGGYVGGGGGAGGLVYSTSQVLPPGSYNIVVGAGGTGSSGAANVPGGDGQNSVFGSLTALGGGGGVGYNLRVGRNGGCGGGAASATVYGGGPDTGGLGLQVATAISPYSGKNGSGAGGGGGMGAAANSLSGGIGLQFAITGTNTYYAGGGGGGGNGNQSVGGLGGGGAGGNLNYVVGQSATAGTGGGGGGGGSGAAAGGAGGSGIFVISFPQIGSGTLKYSTNKGLAWSNATGGFTTAGYELIYANNVWLASGVNQNSAVSHTISMKYSTDGSNWSNVDASLPPIDVSASPIAPLPLGSMNYDGSNWNVFRHAFEGGQWRSKIFSALNVSGTWTPTDVSANSFIDVPNDANRRFVTYSHPQFLRPVGSRRIDIAFAVNPELETGPIVSPPSSSFLLYQYVPMSVQLTAQGNGTVYFFITNADLPPGLTFNRVTNIISGKPAESGLFTTRVYAKDNAGVTTLTYTFTVNIPRIIRKQDGAGAYTSLLKQYTEVLAAQSARDARVFPTELVRLGEFMSPVPRAVITQTFNTRCGDCGRIECPASNARVDANDEGMGGAFTEVCNFIDANSGEVFEAGSAERNVCDT